MGLKEFISHVGKKRVVKTIWGGHEIACFVKGFSYENIPNSYRRRYWAVLEKPGGATTTLLLKEIVSIKKL